MTIIDAAINEIQRAEAALRDLLQQGLIAKQYSEIRIVAELANGLAKLTDAYAADFVSMSSPQIEQPDSNMGTGRAASAAGRAGPLRSRKGSYPKFMRDHHRLVKIGWSKRNKSEYEHRVPKDVALTIVERISEKSENELFAIEDLLPMHDLEGSEIPAYQVYVSIAWLRQINVLERKGREGYAISDPSKLAQRVILWKGLPLRRKGD